MCRLATDTMRWSWSPVDADGAALTHRGGLELLGGWDIVTRIVKVGYNRVVTLLDSNKGAKHD